MSARLFASLLTPHVGTGTSSSTGISLMVGFSGNVGQVTQCIIEFRVFILHTGSALLSCNQLQVKLDPVS